VDVHEPLAGRPEDQRAVTAPAVRVAVHDAALAEEGARLAQSIDHCLVAGLQVQPGERPGFLGEVSTLVHRREDPQTELLPGEEVLAPVPGRGVDDARAALERDVARRHYRR